MGKQNRITLKNYFQTGKVPTQGEYADLIDSFMNLEDEDIQLVKFARAQGAYSERTFGPEFEDAIENADLSVVSNFTDNPTIKINSNNKLLVQFRARVDADKRANGYRIKLRQVLEAGTGLFYL